jgi:hypothetical protein
MVEQLLRYRGADRGLQQRHNRNMVIDLNNITSFFKPSRQVWQEYPESAGDKSKPFDFTDTTVGEYIKTGEFMEQITDKSRSMCGKTQFNIECSLSGMNDMQEKTRFRILVDQLYENFLYKMEGGVKIKDSFQRLQELKGSCDMEKILECFREAQSYKIETYSMAEWERNPALKDKIIFTYPNGKTKTVNLELSVEKKRGIFLPFFRGLKVMAGRSGGDSEETETIQDEFPENAGLENKEAMKEIVAKETENLIERSKKLNTPQSAYSELVRIAPNLPSSFLEDISGPLAEYEDIISRCKVINGGLQATPEDMEKGRHISDDVKNTLTDYFGYNYESNMSKGQLADLSVIVGKFGLE